MPIMNPKLNRLDQRALQSNQFDANHCRYFTQVISKVILGYYLHPPPSRHYPHRLLIILELDDLNYKWLLVFSQILAKLVYPKRKRLNHIRLSLCFYMVVGDGFELIKIGATDGEKVLAAIDNLAAQGAKEFVICPPDVRLRLLRTAFV